MQFPESWLREFCDPPLSTAEFADLLTMAGLEVEETRPAAPPFDGVVVGRVLACERHPNADKLSVCAVDIGAAAPLSVVCGAPNVRAGIKVPCATVGARLPAAQAGGEPFAITLSTLRGVQSQGMLCSARELKLSDDHGGLLLLADDAPVGEDIRRHLALDDTLFTLKLTPNLGHALSVYGVAREVAALTGAPLRSPSCLPVAPRHDQTLKVTVEAPDLCGRFSGRLVRHVNPQAKTPAWMVERLARCGQRSVTALVDISNYVMFERGQPTHIFDADRIAGGGLTVRWGRAGETLELLNGSTVELDAQVGVIADAQGAVESLAGIMGGDATAVSDDTRNVYVEAAFWWPEAVAGRSRRFNFSTDAGHRFERGVDPAGTVPCIERITQLIVDICGGDAGPVDDQTLSLPPCEPVAMRIARAAKVIGMPLTTAQCATVFTRQGFAFSEHTAGTLLTATPPSWRFDLRIEEDLIEEVIRVIGFDRLPQTPPLAPLAARVRPETRRGLPSLRARVAALGYVETINYSFVEARSEHELAGNPDPIRVLNPIAAPLSVMRSSLLGGLLGVLRHNLARKATRVRVFEAGRVFRRDARAADGPAQVAGIRQPLRVAGLAFGPADAAQWGVKERAVDFFDVKGDVQALLAPRQAVFVAAEHPALHPGRCARVEVDGAAVGFVGELHPRWRQAHDLPSAPVLFELDSDALDERPLPAPVPVARQQPAWRDVALIAGPAVSHDALIAAVRDVASAHEPADGDGAASLIRHAELFDLYQPPAPTADIAVGERSMAVRLQLQDDAAPLTDSRIDAAVAALLVALHGRLGVRLRG